MAKREIVSGIDTGNVIRAATPGIRNKELQPYDPAASAPAEKEEPPTEAAAEPEPSQEKEPAREEPRRKKNRAQDYESLFFKSAPIKTRSGKVAYIRKEHHDRILKIVRVIGENEFTLFNYLDNVLEHHFSAYQDEITELYNKKNTDVF